jgi:hypothetical protein
LRNQRANRLPARRAILAADPTVVAILFGRKKLTPDAMPRHEPVIVLTRGHLPHPTARAE